MTHHITLREANQHLSRYIDRVQQGEDFIITRRGRPVAKLSSVAAEKTPTPEQQAAWEQLLQGMRAGYSLGGWRFNREELYER
jgi:prevent-host-death family protein